MSGPVVPVLIAGGGPVGLALAIELGLREIDCLLVERRDGALPVPKMSQVSTRNMEFCRRWGIAEQVRNAAWSDDHPHDFVYATSLLGAELARVPLPSYAERGDLGYTPEGSSHCPQTYFDPVLVARAKSLPHVTMRYNTGLESFSQDGDAVHARLSDSDSGAAETVTARYLVGCDGAGGIVRDSLGIELEGLGVVANSINIFFRSPDLVSRHDKGWARFYRLIDATGCWAELIAIDGDELWRLTIFDEPSEDVDADRFLRRAMGAEFPYEIISVTPWERRDYVARHYGQGRVFIAGDAAHQCSPTGGMGMHTGLGEAVNLAWKLAAQMQGWGGMQLLASYESECRPIARHNVDLATRAFKSITSIPGGDALEEDSPEGARQRNHYAGGDFRLARYSVNEFEKNLYGYAASPICVPDAPQGDDDDQPFYGPKAMPGMRAPHGWLDDGRSILDLFGDGYVLLRLGAEAPDADGLINAAKARNVPVASVDIADDAVARLYQRRLVLVRPDGHVAWRGDVCPPDPVAIIDRARGALN